MKYLNRIRRKRFVLNTKTKALGYVSKTIDSIESFIDSTKTLDTLIIRQIKEGLDYGFSPRFNLYSGSIYNPSIENEYINYHKESADDKTYEKIFNVLVNTLLPNYFAKYTDIEIITGEDSEGRYFEVKLI